MPGGGTLLLVRHELLVLAVVLAVSARVSGRGVLGRPRAQGENIDSKSMNSAVDFLTKYGYLPQSDLETGNLRTEEQLRGAIREMQRFAGVAPTGVVDEQTLQIMRKKRCGVPDLVGTSERVKRYALQGAKWDKADLTWSIEDSTNRLNHDEIRRELTQAFKVWSDVSLLTFREMPSRYGSDIAIRFVRGSHGDGYTFDGPGSVLAHAFFPGPGLGGDTHFDSEEAWEARQIEGSNGVSLFAVAAHEFGHSLGLSHSRETSALMYPYYQWFGPNYKLPDDDRMGIEQLYGAKNERKWATLPELYTQTPHVPRVTRPPPTRATPVPGRPEPPRTTASTKKPHQTDRPVTENPVAGKPKTCDTSYDAISIIRREIFIFKNKYFWRLDDRGVQTNYPVAIDRFWYNLPKDLKRIDAVYERPGDKKIVFFIGAQYWVFDANHPVQGYPRPLERLGLPRRVKHIDAAMVWGHNGKTYFFSGSEYWRFDETEGTVELDYPRDMAMWKGVPYNVDAAFQGTDGRTYFFKDKGFWKFDDQKMRVANEEPLPSAKYWMACTDSSSTSVKSQYARDYDTDYDSASASSAVPHEPCRVVVIVWLFALAVLVGAF